MKRQIGLLFILGLLSLATATTVRAQTNAYHQTNLVSDISGLANHTDPKLVNPWGISFFPGQPFWIADNNSGFSTLYDAAGNMDPSLPFITIPPPMGSSGSATPTGTVINSTPGFVVGGAPSLFLFDTEDGTISGWNGGGTKAILAVDRSTVGLGAVYKGLAIINNTQGTFLLATNFRSGQVEVFDSNFKLTNLMGSFTDPTLPAGFAPFGIQTIGSQVFVTYALQDSAKHDPVSAPGNGFVNIFNTNGVFVKRLASNGTLNSPWGVTMAPSNFGMFSSSILVGNFGDGTINAFDPSTNTNNFQGQLQDGNGNVIANSGLWTLVFGSGGTGNPNTLYFTAGLAGESHGLFGSLDVGQGGGGGSDFVLTASPMSATVTAGNSTHYILDLLPTNGFTGAVTFSCSGPMGITCTFTPSSVNVTGIGASTTMTVMTSASVTHYGATLGGSGTWLALSGLGFLGVVVGVEKKRRKLLSVLLGGSVVLVLAATLLGSIGCNSTSTMGTNRGTASIAITATSGTTLMHTAMVTLTVK